jgi:hypothetical protein
MKNEGQDYQIGPVEWVVASWWGGGMEEMKKDEYG